jgi:hypothetical protein
VIIHQATTSGLGKTGKEKYLLIFNNAAKLKRILHKPGQISVSDFLHKLVTSF